MNKNALLLSLLALPIVLVVYLVSHLSGAPKPSPIMGKWIEKFSDGSGMVTEFNPATMASYRVDVSGKPIDQVNQIGVTYKDMDHAIGVSFKDGSGMVVMVTRPNAIILNFPGMAPHQLVKFELKPLK